ncbi:hypothetical protein DVH24_037664 [Malus domestica]|uniref:No apical meristem-associated C-terminal domain-containing protein n=1 Tax=Malus domestica TaxID=3750 RepID=A0A498IX68_MALDO|nr:hypothetical protein DVH24_037664 [Malus domestica]
MPMFGNASSNTVGDEYGSPIVQETRVENLSSSEGSIPRAIRRNKTRRARQEMESSIQFVAEQNAFAVEERNRRHEEQAKQIQEETDDRNMQRNTSDYTPMSKAYFDRKKREIMVQRELFISDYNPTMADDDDDNYRL